MLRFPKPAPTPPNQQNQQNPPFFGFHKKSGWMKTTFPPGLWSSGSFHSKWSNAWSHGHSPRTRPGHAMVRVRWLKGWLETDGRRGWEIKQKTLGGWRLLVMLVHGIRSDVFFYMTFVGGWQLNFGCLMLYLPQNGWFIIMENPIKMDDLGVPLFSETPIWYEQLYILDHWFLSFTQNRGRRCFSLSRNRGVFFTLSTFPF